jgi:phosphoglycolate phosphatase
VENNSKKIELFSMCLEPSGFKKAGYLMFSNIFFDLDGTLTDSQEGILKCFIYALNELGRPCAGELKVSDVIGPPLRSAFRKLLDSNDEILIEKAVSLYRERYERACLLENHLYPGILDLISALHANSLKLYVVTTKPKIWADKIVRHFQLDRWFTEVFGTDLNGRFDSKTEHLEFILSHLKLAPGETMIVGDRREDILAGKNNRIRTIGVTFGYGNRQEIVDAAPDYICDSPLEIQKTIMGLR